MGFEGNRFPDGGPSIPVSVSRRIVVSSAVLPWPKRIRSKMSDKKHYVNYREPHVNLARPIPIPAR